MLTAPMHVIYFPPVMLCRFWDSTPLFGFQAKEGFSFPSRASRASGLLTEIHQVIADLIIPLKLSLPPRGLL